MLEKLFTLMEKIWLYVLIFAFAAVFTVQLYFLWQPEVYQTKMAARIGAEVKTDMDDLWVAAAKNEMLFTYLTMEAADGKAAAVIVLIDGVRAGTLESGLLTVKVEEGDKVSICNNGDDTVGIAIADFPGILDASIFPDSISAQTGTQPWGTVHFK